MDATVGAWLADRLHRPGHRRVIAVDGKRLRGSGRDGHQVHLLAAAGHYDGGVVAQRDVPTATNEIAVFAPLLAGLDLAGVVVTADALHTQRARRGSAGPGAPSRPPRGLLHEYRRAA